MTTDSFVKCIDRLIGKSAECCSVFFSDGYELTLDLRDSEFDITTDGMLWVIDSSGCESWFSPEQIVRVVEVNFGFSRI